MYIRYTCCATSDHLVHAFCTDEFCSTRVSIKLLPHYTFLENVLVGGKARNKHCQVNVRKSSYKWVILGVCLRLAKAHISLHTRDVCLQPLQSSGSIILWAESKIPYQTACMRRLITDRVVSKYSDNSRFLLFFSLLFPLYFISGMAFMLCPCQHRDEKLSEVESAGGIGK